MRKPLCVAALALLVLTACKPEDVTSGGTPGSTSAGSSSSAPGKEWTMPNMVGKDLQDAQDAMQKLTGDPLFLTTSHDATGAKRQQVIDRNWKVCSQTPTAGTTIVLKSVIDFGAVKNEENCP